MLVLIRGAGDLASGIALRLHHARMQVVIQRAEYDRMLCKGKPSSRLRKRTLFLPEDGLCAYEHVFFLFLNYGTANCGS